MPRMPRISSKEAIRALERLGFEQVRQTGSHVVMKKEIKDGKIGCVVPLHRELFALALRSKSCYIEQYYQAITSIDRGLY